MKLIIAVLTKEIKSEFRTRYAISAVILFVLTTVVMIVFATAGEMLNNQISSGILWVIMFFGAMTGLSKSFVSEEERGTSLLLQLTTQSSAVFFGKLIFNMLLALSLNIFAVVLLLTFFSNLNIGNFGLFVVIIILGSIAIASATTIISALIAKANSKNALFPVLSFPILLPIIILGIQITSNAFSGATFAKSQDDLQLIFSYTGIMILASYYLFDIVWKD